MQNPTDFTVQEIIDFLQYQKLSVFESRRKFGEFSNASIFIVKNLRFFSI
jgi:hypothetical protein